MDEQMQTVVDGFASVLANDDDVMMASLDVFVARGYITVEEVEGWASEIKAYLSRQKQPA